MPAPSSFSFPGPLGAGTGIIDAFLLLKEMGQKDPAIENLGCIETIEINKGIFYAFADPRRLDEKAAGN